MNDIRAFILCAGLGERLRPITNHIPKPLVPIIGHTPLQMVLDKVSVITNEPIGVNLHHRASDIKQWVEGSAYNNRVRFFMEAPILGTGGALKNAEDFLEGSNFIVHNADIVSDIDLYALVKKHLSSGNLATLALHDYPKFNNVIVDKGGYLHSVGRMNAESCKLMAFTGIAVYSPEFLGLLPTGSSSVVDAWMKAVNEGHRIGTNDVSGARWTDIGTPSSYARLVADTLKNRGDMIYVGGSAVDCGSLNLDGIVSIDNGAIIESGVELRNTIVLPGARLTTGLYENSIVGEGFVIPLDETDFMEYDETVKGFLIGTGGSDRRYYRTDDGVLMKCRPDDPDFDRHISYSEFFINHGVSVPRLLDVYLYPKKEALFEDLGDLSLYNWLKCPRPYHEVEQMYTRVIDALILIHKLIESIDECPLLKARRFDYEHLRWETSYFLERFVTGLKGLGDLDDEGLERDFDLLARSVSALPKSIVHRDFQSQNVMIKEGEVRVIDFQGARIGPPAYDIASMLFDPYYRLDDGVRSNLIDYYVERTGVDLSEFARSLNLCCLQRHMQALGAYGFLSVVKGKHHFLNHVDSAVRYLKEDVLSCEIDIPAIRGLVERL